MWAWVKSKAAVILGVVIGTAVLLAAVLRGLFDPRSAKHEAAKLDVEKKAEAVEEKKAEVKAAEANAAAVHESVETRLASLEAKAQADAAKDTVDVANDLIKGA